MSIKIKCDEVLFNELKSFDQNLASIVQNDMVLTDEDYEDWLDRCAYHRNTMHLDYLIKKKKFEETMKKVIQYVKNCRE